MVDHPRLEQALAEFAELLLEDFAEQNGGRPYPYTFYGNPNYLAENRADCVEFLRGFHTGTLQPGGGPG